MALEIRTILVTTRAAVRRHREAGRPDLVALSVERGALLLKELEARRAREQPPSESYEAAHRQLESLHTGGDGTPAVSRPG